MRKAKRSLSQNFLIDKNISNKIVNQSDIKNKIVLEIGPGYGFLTDNILIKKPKKLFLIEKDRKLSIILKKKYKYNKNVIILEEDILKYKFDNFKKLIIISNLPYNISTKIILYLFKFNKNISEMIFMVQKEVAEKFDYNLPNMNKYKFLTKISTLYTRCFNVSSKCFIPQPKVKSTVVKFKFQNSKFDINKSDKFVNQIFKNVRKKIYKNIKLNKTGELLYNKRVNELKIEELLNIYNSF